MALSRKQLEAIRERRAQVAPLVLAKRPYMAIARTLGVDRATIIRDVRALEDEWRKKLVDDPVAVKAQELAELEEMERECVTKYINTGAGIWMDRRLRLKERRAKMLGLDAPQEISGPGGGPIQFDDSGLIAKLQRMAEIPRVIEGQGRVVEDNKAQA